MKKIEWIIVCSLIFATGQARSEDSTVLKTDKDRLSYSMGVSIGKNFKKEKTDVDFDLMMKGLKSAMAGEHLLLTDKEWRTVLNSYQTEVLQHAKLTKQQAMETNKKKGDTFLAENKDKKGVVVLPSGVQYKIIKAGNGPKPDDSSMVQVNYSGKLIDGTEFDATEPGHPANFKLSALIPGWKEALKLMPAGSKWQIVVPSQLAYGERGAGADIEPNSTLVFEVELVAINQ